MKHSSTGCQRWTWKPCSVPTQHGFPLLMSDPLSVRLQLWVRLHLSSSVVGSKSLEALKLTDDIWQLAFKTSARTTLITALLKALGKAIEEMSRDS